MKNLGEAIENGGGFLVKRFAKTFPILAFIGLEFEEIGIRLQGRQDKRRC